MKRIVVVLLILSIAACTPPNSPPTNLLIGDSLSVQMGLHAYAAIGPDGVVNADPGRGLTNHGFWSKQDGIEALQSNMHTTESGSDVVVELGTNDVWGGQLPYNGGSSYRNRIREALDVIPLDRCVIWVGIFNRYDIYGLGPLWTSIVQSELDKRGGCHAYIDWHQINIDLERRGMFTLVEEDGVHLNPLGVLALQNNINWAIENHQDQ